ncbi:MAG: T9SS type A sorting domain-containing protein [Phaeodactylibacter sp.]|nr:T9SS type A sorting domain-containing protein [Phaeodactylibacter sp.]MCB9303917.1 T9SS type A sorting domain-containing protein [Lewinellaceae bacterium]
MKKLNFLLLTLALSLTASVQAQGPYLEALYDVQVTPNQVYGVNATILPVLFQQSTEAVPQPLVMDIYEPVGDDNEARPVMLVFHTGNFLPFPQNNGTGGTIRDSTVVELCTRLAQRGYLAASVDYRLGWNPVDPSQDIRKFFLINAAYRGLQDARTAVRYMRKLAVDENNPYKIDPDRIGLWGVGTGGYITAATATLDAYIKVVIPKFLINLGAGTVPMVIEQVNGNIYGTSVGVVPPGYPVLPPGDTLCYPNHVTYADGSPISSDILMVINNGGALGDISWIDENTVPWVSFQVPTDPFAPYTTGTLTVPGTGDPADPSDDFAVVEVSGAYDIQAKLNELGINDIFESIPAWAPEDYSEVANSRNNGFNGLFPFPTGVIADSAPWDFYAADNPNVPPNPPPNPERARMYWDTIMAYAGVRACIGMDLPCLFVNTKQVGAAEVNLKLAPNPASDEVMISADAEHPMRSIELYDINGRLLRTYFDVDSNQFILNREGASSGIYFLRLRFKEGAVIQKLIFD